MTMKFKSIYVSPRARLAFDIRKGATYQADKIGNQISVRVPIGRLVIKSQGERFMSRSMTGELLVAWEKVS